jgi:hypothetical protein
MLTSEQFVLENKDLRKEILKHIVYEKYKDELYYKIKKMLDDEIVKNWYKFCSCDVCTIKMRLNNEFTEL